MDERHIILPPGVHVHRIDHADYLLGSREALIQIRDQINTAIGVDPHAERMAKELDSCRHQLWDCERRVRVERECSNLA